MRSVPVDVLVDLSKLRLRAALVHLRRIGLVRVAATLPTALLDDGRIAATEELARRGFHVITYRPRSRKVA